jgi:thiol-disulfide isomerase/thioredoxin
LRQKLGNVWRLVHGSEAGLGEKLLEAYDQHWGPPENAGAAKRNAEAAALSAFVVRRLAGDDLRLEAMSGKVVVLSFWATWCFPCQEVERLLARLAGTYRGNEGVAFLSVNCDDNEALARAFAENAQMRGAVVFEDGLRGFFNAGVLPTVIVLDRAGQIAYRGEGFSPANLEKEVTAAIERGLAPPAQP